MNNSRHVVLISCYEQKHIWTQASSQEDEATMQLLFPSGYQTHRVKAEDIRSIHHNIVM